jgi:hypothetical protein
MKLLPDYPAVLRQRAVSPGHTYTTIVADCLSRFKKMQGSMSVC